MTTRNGIHALVDELADEQLEVAEEALEAIRRGGFELSDEECAELRSRRAAAERGDIIEARAFLAAIREERSDSQG